MIIRKRPASLLPLWLVAGIVLGWLPGGEDACGAPRRPRRLRVLPAQVEPWDLSGEPRPFEEVCFQDRSGLGGLGETEARKLLEPVAGQRLEIQPQPRESAMRFVRFSGLAKLRSWAPDAVLRWSFAGPTLQVHFWTGRECLTLSHNPGRTGSQWLAYRQPWAPGQRPASPHGGPCTSLVATDDFRVNILQEFTLEARWQEGAIVLTRGDVRLLTAPLEGQPAAVYIESAQGVMLGDLAVCRSGPVPDDPVGAHRIVLGQGSPAALRWKETLPAGARLQRLSDGGVELTAGKSDQPAWALVSPPPAGPCEVVFELDNPTPGSGVFLADEKGQPLSGIEFMTDSRTGWTAFEYGMPGQASNRSNLNADWYLTLYAAPRQWLRLVACSNSLACWISGDGVHWGRTFGPVWFPGGWRQAGIFLQPSQSEPSLPTRHIRLRSISVRQLDGLTDLAPPALLRQAASRRAKQTAKSPWSDVATWRKWVGQNLPAGADEAAWRCACSLDALVGDATTNHEVVVAALEQLLDDGPDRAASFQARIHLLQDAALLLDGSNPEEHRRYLETWQRLGRSVLLEVNSAGFDLLRKSFAAASLPNPERRFDLVSPPLARDWLLVLLGQQQWRELYQCCSRLMFWHQTIRWRQPWPQEEEPLRRLVEWLLGELGGVRAGPNGHKSIAVEDGWQHGLTVSVNRDAFAAVSDLEAAAGDRLYPDAAQVLAGNGVAPGAGLVPDAADVQLFTSYHTAVKLLIEHHPQLQREVAARFKAADELRVREAIARADQAAMEAFVVQYYGTPAAAAAHRWLGDRLLSGGEFSQALLHYRKALPTASPGQRPALEARIRLASAMLGRDAGQPIRSPVVLGETEVAPQLFEQWVREMRERYRNAGATALAPAGVGPLAAPGAFEPKPCLKLDADAGAEPQQVPWQIKGLDWLARQLALVPAGNVLLVANRFQVAAIDPAAGKILWTYGLGSNQAQTHVWPLLPMRPAVAGDRVYARLMPKSGHPLVVCLDLASGKKRWECEGPIDLVSDPLPLGERLFALAAEAPPGQLSWQLLWIELDRDSGDVLRRKPLVELRGDGAPPWTCQAAVVDDSVVASVGGILLAVDSEQNL
ncbi:MAG: PQQ-binding-like beta-propeller repeat protein, partial [Thermoguttaceae bacterium]